jgi:glutamate--cysteine ligase
VHDRQPSASDSLPRDAQELAVALARKGRGGKTKAGIELELGVLRASDLSPVPYGGPDGIGALLERLEQDFPQPVLEAGQRIALRSPEGGSITIEPGGQCELSGAPGDTVGEALRRSVEEVRAMGRAADELGLILVAGGLQVAAQASIPWMPKARYRVMREWFASLEQAGHLAHHMMQRTLSLQVSLDYQDEADVNELLELAFCAAPAATAIWAASPYSWEPGESEAFQSYRAECWRYTDPGRQGLIKSQLGGGSLLGYAEHVLAAPMMFRILRGGPELEHVAMRGASFAELLARGEWGDGVPVSRADFDDHLGSLFTDARVKAGLIELRSTDGPVPGLAGGEDPLLTAMGEIPAFWVGLAYDLESRAAALTLLRSAAPHEIVAAHAAVPRQGLAAPWGSRRVGDVARELAALAQSGLERLAAAGREEPWVAGLLDGVLARLDTGRTPADSLREAYEAGGKPALVELLRLPT